jgi:hypothetical protein
MAENIGRRLRDDVRARAGGRCEYCRTGESMLLTGCEVDHILSRKHGGKTDLSNLALSCVRCNRAKGTDVGSRHAITGEYIRLFDPRLDRWDEHFLLEGVRIVGMTPIGEVTVGLLHLNDEERIKERRLLLLGGWRP